MSEFCLFQNFPEFVFAVIDCSLCSLSAVCQGAPQKEELLKHKESTQWYTVVVFFF